MSGAAFSFSVFSWPGRSRLTYSWLRRRIPPFFTSFFLLSSSALCCSLDQLHNEARKQLAAIVCCGGGVGRGSLKGREGKDSPYLKVKGPAAEREKEREASFSLSFDSSADFVFVHYMAPRRVYVNLLQSMSV